MQRAENLIARLPGYLDQDRIFLETTRRLAPPRLAEEDVRLALGLALPEGTPVGCALADLGCGYGRHLRALENQGYAGVLGVDRSALLLAAARSEAPSARLLRADLRALPLRARSVDAAFCFYSSMFLGSDDDARAALAEAARALKLRGRLVLTTDNPLRLRASPHASFAEDVPGLGRVIEESTFDASRSVDEVTRRLEHPQGGSNLSATFRIRYYAPAELSALARAAGLRLARLEPDAPLSVSTPQLIALFTLA